MDHPKKVVAKGLAQVSPKKSLLCNSNKATALPLCAMLAAFYHFINERKNNNKRKFNGI